VGKTVTQLLSNFLWLRTLFTAPKTAADTFVLSKFFDYHEITFWSLLGIITSTSLQVSSCRHIMSPKSNIKGQSTCNMNMSDYSCGAIKVNNNGPNGQRLDDFYDWRLVYGTLNYIHGHLGGSPSQFKNPCCNRCVALLKQWNLIFHTYLANTNLTVSVLRSFSPIKSKHD